MRNRGAGIDKELLRKLVIDEGLGLTETAKRLGVCRRTAGHAKKLHNIFVPRINQRVANRLAACRGCGAPLGKETQSFFCSRSCAAAKPNIGRVYSAQTRSKIAIAGHGRQFENAVPI